MSTRHGLKRRWPLCLACLWIAWLCGPAMAQLGTAPGVVPGVGGGIDLMDMPPLPQAPQVAPAHLLAEQFAVVALQQAAGLSQPGDAQFQAMHLLLEQAVELKDQDPEIHRLRIELARRMGRLDIEQQAIQKYLALQPEDDAAQLDLVLLHLAKAQTLETRLSMLQRLLEAPANQAFSPPLRSRLASLAAAAAMEIGDIRTMRHRLRQAAQWDPSNRQAMAMIVQTLQDVQESSRLERGMAILGLLRADPINPLPRRALADLLLEEGAYDLAADQYTAAQRLGGDVGDEMFYRAWITALIVSGRTEQALLVLQGLEQSLAPAPAPGIPGTSAELASSSSLPVALEMLRYAILAGRESIEAIRQSQERLAQWTKPDGASSALNNQWLDPLELAWLKVALGPMAQVQKIVDALPPSGSALSASLEARIRGYAAMRQGKNAQAVALLEPLADHDPAARLALAMMRHGGTQGGRVAAIAKVLREVPVGLVAVMAAQELQSQRTAILVSPTGLALGRELRQLSRAVREADMAAQPWLQLSVEPSAPYYNYLDPVKFKVSLRNMTDLPLALEPQGPIPAQLMMLIQPVVMGRVMKDFSPLVVDLRRRLVLAPREKLEVIARLDFSEFGDLLARTPMERITFAGRMALDMRAMAGDQVQVGPLGKLETLRSMDRYGLGLTLRGLEAWLAALDDPSLVVQMQSAAWLLALHPRLSGAGPEARESADRIQDALLKRYDSASPLLQAWMARALQTDERGSRSLQPLHDRLEANRYVPARLMYLATQVSDPNAPALEAALRDSDPLLSQFAQARRTLLQERASANAATALPRIP